MDTNFYPPQNNGPHTTIAETINTSQTSITVANAAILPDAPNVLTIGTEEDAELVLMESKTGNILAVQRGYNGTTAKAWGSGAWIYRAITAQDVQALQKRQENYMIRLTAEAYEARTLAQRQQDYEDGVRGYLVEGGLDVDMATNYGYVLDAQGNATPISDPNAIQRGEAVELAEDSQKLGGKPASEYFLAENAGELGRLKMELVWQNANTTSDFAAQTVNMNLAGYEFVYVLFQENKEKRLYSSAITKTKDESNVFFFYNYRLARRFAVNTSGITFEDASEANYNAQMYVSNKSCIPVAVYGIKGVG